MDLTVTIESNDRTSLIDWHSFRIDSMLGRQVNTCSFKVKTSPTQTWYPTVGDEIEVVDDTTTIFAGVIVQIEQSVDGLLVSYQVQCKDWIQYLDRVLVVNKEYTDETVDDIIDDLNTNYLSGFTITNVDCATSIPYIYFDKIKVSQCLEQLANQVGYNWYVDYDKDIHFYDDTEDAPFDLTDTNGNYIFNSLKLTDDITQLRNKIYVIADPANKITSGTVDFTWPGSPTREYFFDYVFYPKPSCAIGGSGYTVGIDGVDDPASWDLMWNNYTRRLFAPPAKYCPPSAAANLSGDRTLYKEYEDSTSVATYGEYMYADDGEISDLDEAQQYAETMLTKYKDKQQRGTFRTYTSGLKPGQIINLQSTIRGISATDFIIQGVSLTMRSSTDGEWNVEIATWRTLNLINILEKSL